MSDPIAQAHDAGRRTLTEAEAKSLLSDAGIKTPEFEVASTAEEAGAAAERIGLPVVVKVSSPAVTHKSEWAGGLGVNVGLESSDEVVDVTEEILSTAEDRGIEANVLVEEAANLDRGTEVIVGGLRDPSFGPVVLTGLGGVFTEIFEDTSHRIAPIDDSEAKAAIDELQAKELLEGYRGREPADIEALAGVVRRVGNLLVEHESIAEIDVNPVLTTSDGATALDALVVLEEEV